MTNFCSLCFEEFFRKSSIWLEFSLPNLALFLPNTSFFLSDRASRQTEAKFHKLILHLVKCKTSVVHLSEQLFKTDFMPEMLIEL